MRRLQNHDPVVRARPLRTQSRLPAADDAGHVQERLAVAARDAAELLGISRAQLWKLHSSGKMPRPVRLGAKATRWRVDELRAWLKAGCPDRTDMAEDAGACGMTSYTFYRRRARVIGGLGQLPHSAAIRVFRPPENRPRSHDRAVYVIRIQAKSITRVRPRTGRAGVETKGNEQLVAENHTLDQKQSGPEADDAVQAIPVQPDAEPGNTVPPPPPPCRTRTRK